MVDELHSHLYLTSFWCESRWKEYVPNQQTRMFLATLLPFSIIPANHRMEVPLCDFEEEAALSDPILAKAANPPSPTTAAPRRTRLDKYLEDLNLRANDQPFDLNEQNAPGTGLMSSASSSVIPGSSSRNSMSIVPTSSSYLGLTPQHPEADSFAYIETLLESLAILSKLGSALDVVSQKLPQEIYALVETTLDEVSERAEYGRRGTMISPLVSGVAAGRIEDVYLLATSGSSTGFGPGITSIPTAPSMVAPAGNGLVPSSTLRLTALEASTKYLDQETMRDLFWTLYSKLEAVSQGLRVVYEVANRIGSVRHAFL